jgi:cell division protein FtsB
VLTRKPKNPGTSRRRRRLVEGVLMVVGSVVLLDAFFGDQGLVEMLKAREEGRALAEKIAQVKGVNLRLDQEINSLLTDPEAIEELARRELGMIKPGEKVYVLRDQETPEP